MAAKYIRSLDCRNVSCISVVTNAAVKEGDILAITSGLVGPLDAADSSVIGIACSDAASGSEVQVLLINEMSVIRVPVTGSTKTSLVAADRFGTKFDWDATNKKLNLDDTTGGILQVVSYNNTAKTADVVVAKASLWNA